MTLLCHGTHFLTRAMERIVSVSQGPGLLEEDACETLSKGPGSEQALSECSKGREGPAPPSPYERSGFFSGNLQVLFTNSFLLPFFSVPHLERILNWTIAMV